MAVEDVLLLSDRMAGESKVVGEVGTSIEKATCCSSDDTSHKVKIVLEARQRAIEKIIYFSACVEQSSEHPIAKGMSIEILRKAYTVSYLI
jgi:hypothetical protein